MVAFMLAFIGITCIEAESLVRTAEFAHAPALTDRYNYLVHVFGVFCYNENGSINSGCAPWSIRGSL